MAILRNRDELLPVTCGILKDAVRDKFFATLKKKSGGKIERLARTAGVTVAVANGWSKGEIHIPYYSLQLLATEFKIDLPEISELRREYQQVAEAPKNLSLKLLARQHHHLTRKRQQRTALQYGATRSRDLNVVERAHRPRCLHAIRDRTHEREQSRVIADVPLMLAIRLAGDRVHRG